MTDMQQISVSTLEWLKKRIELAYTSPALSDQQALVLLQEIEAYVHDRAEEIIAELEERGKE